MALNFRKALMAGTALVAVASFSGQAHALDRVLTANGTWASSGTCNAATAVIADACANDAVDITAAGAATLTITTGGPDDGSGATTFNLGAVTNSGGTGGAISIAPTGNTTITANIASVDIGGAFAVANTDTATGAATVAITSDATIGGALTLTNVNTTADNKDVAMTVGGDLSVTGAVTLTAAAGNGAGANTSLTVGGDLSTGGITMDDDTGVTTLTLNGTSAQSVTGTIIGAGAGEGALVVSNTSSGGVTFNSAVGGTQLKSLLVSNNGNNVSATFKATTNIAAMTLGNGAGTDTNTITFDASGGAFTVTGTIKGDGAGNDTAKVTIQGGTVTTASAWGGGGNVIDELTVTGSSAALTAGAAINATKFTLASGGTINTGAQTLTGDIDGTGSVVATGSGTVTGNIGNTTKITAVTINTGNTLTVSGNVKATTTTLVGAGSTLALTAAAHTVDSAIVSTPGTAGVITIADGNATTAFTGNVGTSSKTLASLAVAGNGGNTVTTTGNLYVDAITVGGATDTLQLLGTSAQTVSGTYQTGVLTVGNGTATSDVTFSGILGGGTALASINVTAAAKATFNDDVTTAGALTNNGTLTVAAGKTIATASVADGGTGTFNIGVTRAAGGAMSIGKITESGDAANYTTGDTINFVVASTAAPLTAGTLASVFTGNAGASVTGLTVTDNSYLYKFVPTVNGNDIDVVVSIENSIASLANNAGNASVGTALLGGLVNSTNADINTIQGKLASASTQAEVNEVLESVQPTVDGSSMASMTNVGASIQSINDIRLASARKDDGLTGLAAGSSANGVSMWFQGFAQHSNQDRRGGVDGYDADSFGGALGFDSVNMWENGLLGVSFSYGNTDASSDNANRTDTDVDSYGLNLYAGVNIAPEMFLNAQLGYAYNNIDTVRHDSTGPGSGTNASGDTSADQYSAKLQIGKDIATDGGMTLTPTLGASYVHLDTDGYTETGAGALVVSSQDYDVMNLGVGLDMNWNLRNADGSSVKPMIRLGYSYNVINDNVETTAAFAAAPATTFNSVGPEPSRSTFNAGLGVTYATVANWDLSANYDYIFKSDFDAHAGTVRATSRF